MVREPVTFGLSTLVNVLGLAIMLYGMSLTAGQSINDLMVLGGIVVLVGITIHTVGIMSLDTPLGTE